jgi:hypothetical protein
MSGISDKVEPDDNQGRNATDPRFLREATEDLPKDAGSPSCQILERWQRMSTMNMITGKIFTKQSLISRLVYSIISLGLVTGVQAEFSASWLTVGDGGNVNFTVVSTVDELVAAIHRANSDDRPDVIKLRPGRYEFVNRFDTRYGFSVLPLITTEIFLTGTGREETILDAQFQGRHFTILRGGRLVVRGMTITHGATEGRNAYGGGAAIVVNGSLRMDECYVTDNRAITDDLGGGAILSTDSKIHIEESTLSGNVTDGWGGALFISSSKRPSFLVNVIVDGNRADGRGGGISNLAHLFFIRGSTISGNSADGQIPNQARFNGGGGIYNIGTVYVSRSAIVGNSAGPIASGGGIFNSGILLLRGSTVGANTAGTYGGGLFNSARSVINTPAGTRALLENVTMIRNEVLGNSDSCPQKQCTGGGGIWHEPGEPGAYIRIKNTVLAENVIPSNPNVLGQDCGGGELRTLGHNIFGTVTCPIRPHWKLSAAKAQPVDLIGVAPLLGALVDDGQPGHVYYSPLSGSPVIDAARAQPQVDPFIQTCFLSVDQVGQNRVDGDGDGVSVCDIGSIEFQAIAE